MRMARVRAKARPALTSSQYRRGTRTVTACLVLGCLLWAIQRSRFFKASLPGVVSFEGRWVQIDQPSVQDLLTFYGPRHGATCRYEAKRMVNYTAVQQAGIEAERAIKVGSYRWINDHGRFEDWDPVRFIERLIMSKIGLVAIGDSLTVQMVEACKSLLMAPIPAHYAIPEVRDIPVFIDHPNPLPKPKHVINGVEYDVKHSISNIGLNPYSPITAYLKEKHPEIPDERWGRSFVWTIFNDYGITPSVMDDIMRDRGLQGEGDRHLIRLAERANRGDWPKFLTHAEENWLSWPGALKDIVVLNTGAHWPGNFGSAILDSESSAIEMYPEMASGLSGQHIAYAQVTAVLDSFAKYNRTVSGMIRSGYRGHPKCSASQIPWAQTPDFSDPQAFDDHGWYSSPLFDEEWISQIGSRPESGRPQFLDVREMEGLRADAHQEPDLDCLHVRVIALIELMIPVVCSIRTLLVDPGPMARNGMDTSWERSSVAHYRDEPLANHV